MDFLDPQRFRAPAIYTGTEIAAKTGLDLEFALRLRRALGLPEPAEDEAAYAEDDLEVLAGLKEIVDLGFEPDDILVVARAMGQGISRIADAELRLFRRNVIEPLEEGAATESEMSERVEKLVPFLLDLTGRQLDLVHRRHLEIALHHVMAAEASSDNTENLSVAFVDLVDFSRISDDLGPEDLGELVNAFEDIARRKSSERGARVTKMVGDAAMLVSPDPDALLQVVKEIVGEVGADADLPAARAGVDHGAVVPLAGDYYGRPVNVAARITAFAFPGTVVASEAALEAAQGEYRTSKIGTEKLKGVGRVRLFKLKD